MPVPGAGNEFDINWRGDRISLVQLDQFLSPKLSVTVGNQAGRATTQTMIPIAHEHARVQNASRHGARALLGDFLGRKTLQQLRPVLGDPLQLLRNLPAVHAAVNGANDSHANAEVRYGRVT